MTQIAPACPPEKQWEKQKQIATSKSKLLQAKASNLLYHFFFKFLGVPYCVKYTFAFYMASQNTNNTTTNDIGNYSKVLIWIHLISQQWWDEEALNEYHYHTKMFQIYWCYLRCGTLLLLPLYRSSLSLPKFLQWWNFLSSQHEKGFNLNRWPFQLDIRNISVILRCVTLLLFQRLFIIIKAKLLVLFWLLCVKTTTVAVFGRNVLILLETPHFIEPYH